MVAEPIQHPAGSLLDHSQTPGYLDSLKHRMVYSTYSSTSFDNILTVYFPFLFDSFFWVTCWVDAMVRFQIRKKLSPLTSRFSCLMNCCTPLCMQGLSRFHPLFDLESLEPKKGIVWCCMVGKVNSKSKHWS